MNRHGLERFEERVVYRAVARYPERLEHGKAKDTAHEAMVALTEEWDLTGIEVMLEKRIIKESEWVKVAL